MRHPVLAAALAAATLLAPAGALAAPPADVKAAVEKGTAWLRAQQDATTGAIPGFGGDWSLSAFAATGVHPADIRSGSGPSAQDAYLAEWTNADWTDPTDAATGYNGAWFSATDFDRAILLATSAGLQPTRLSAQSNLVAQLAGLSQPNGAYGAPTNLNATVFAVLALNRTHVPDTILRRGADVIRANAHDDGGWNWAAATTPEEQAKPGDIDMTGAALAALCESGATIADPAVAKGLTFLQGKLDPATGAFNAQYGNNADSNAWAVSGLNACGIDPQSAAWTTAQGKTPVDYLLSLQRTDGSFKYSPDEDDSQRNLYASQDAVRALAGGVFAATPPAGRVRPAATVADGTPVPTVLAIDTGKRDARLCRTTAPAGASVLAVLEAAHKASVPPSCVSELTIEAGRVTSLNDASSASGGWVVSLDGGADASAAAQRVGFGDIVSLRLQHTPLPGAVSAGAVDFGAQGVGTVGAAQTVTFTAGGAFAVKPTRAVTTGDDFLVAEDGCADTTLMPGDSCKVRVRFAPSATGARTGTVKLLGNGTGSAALSGTGTTTFAAPPAPAAGTPGPKGDRGPRGYAAKVTCKTVGTKRRSVRCTLKANGSARLTRQGKTVARGTSTTLRAGQRVARGVYTLRVGNLRVAVRIA